MNTVRWNIAVSPDVDQSVRMFIAAQGGGRKGDLSRFIEEAVRAFLLERAVDQAKSAAAHSDRPPWSPATAVLHLSGIQTGFIVE